MEKKQLRSAGYRLHGEQCGILAQANRCKKAVAAKQASWWVESAVAEMGQKAGRLGDRVRKGNHNSQRLVKLTNYTENLFLKKLRILSLHDLKIKFEYG